MLNKSGVHKFYPFQFPDTLNCSTIDISGGTVKRGGVQKVYMRIVTREKHPSLAIQKANEIKEYLYANAKGAFFDGLKVIQIDADTPEPLYIGEENGAYSVSWNYTIIEG